MNMQSQAGVWKVGRDSSYIPTDWFENFQEPLEEIVDINYSPTKEEPLQCPRQESSPYEESTITKSKQDLTSTPIKVHSKSGLETQCLQQAPMVSPIPNWCRQETDSLISKNFTQGTSSNLIDRSRHHSKKASSTKKTHPKKKKKKKKKTYRCRYCAYACCNKYQLYEKHYKCCTKRFLPKAISNKFPVKYTTNYVSPRQVLLIARRNTELHRKRLAGATRSVPVELISLDSKIDVLREAIYIWVWSGHYYVIYINPFKQIIVDGLNRCFNEKLLTHFKNMLCLDRLRPVAFNGQRCVDHGPSSAIALVREFYRLAQAGVSIDDEIIIGPKSLEALVKRLHPLPSEPITRDQSVSVETLKCKFCGLGAFKLISSYKKHRSACENHLNKILALSETSTQNDVAPTPEFVKSNKASTVIQGPVDYCTRPSVGVFSRVEVMEQDNSNLRTIIQKENNIRVGYNQALTSTVERDAGYGYLPAIVSKKRRVARMNRQIPEFRVLQKTLTRVKAVVHEPRQIRIPVELYSGGKIDADRPAVYIYSREKYYFVIYVNQGNQRIADGLNHSFSSLLKQIKDETGLMKLRPVEFEFQLYVDHDASSAVVIATEFARIASRKEPVGKRLIIPPSRLKSLNRDWYFKPCKPLRHEKNPLRRLRCERCRRKFLTLLRLRGHQRFCGLSREEKMRTQLFIGYRQYKLKQSQINSGRTNSGKSNLEKIKSGV